MRLRHGLLTIGLGLLQNARRRATRFRHDTISIGVGLVAEALQILLRRRHVAEGGDDLRGRIDRQQQHLNDLHAAMIAVENLLHQQLRRRLDQLAVGGENFLDLRLPNDFAHRAFGDRLHGDRRLEDVEGEILGVNRIYLPDHAEFDVGDVLVAGQHQAFLRRVRRLRRVPPAARGGLVAKTNLNGVTIGDGQLNNRADGVRQIIIEARLGLSLIFAENQVEADLVGSDGVKSRQQPGQHGQQHEDRGPAPAKAGWQDLPQTFLATPQQFLKVRRRRPAVWAGAPWPALLSPRIIVLIARSALIAPGHFISF